MKNWIFNFLIRTVFKKQRERDLSSFGILSGKDAIRFHERMEAANNHVKTEEEIQAIERMQKNYKLIMEKYKKNNP